MATIGWHSWQSFLFIYCNVLDIVHDGAWHILFTVTQDGARKRRFNKGRSGLHRGLVIYEPDLSWKRGIQPQHFLSSFLTPPFFFLFAIFTKAQYHIAFSETTCIHRRYNLIKRNGLPVQPSLMRRVV